MTEAFSPDQVFVRKLTDIVLANLENEDFGVNELAKESNTTLYSLGRRLQSISGKTVNQFIREVRLRKAMEMLQNREYTASEVAYKTGFGSPAYFNKCFREFYGYSPGKAKNGPSNIHDANANNKDLADGVTGNISWKSYIGSWQSILLIVILSTTFGILIFRNHNKTSLSEGLVSSDGRISVAVMPFLNMTGDTIMNVWQNGIQTCLITSLTDADELKVRQLETILGLLRSKGRTDYASITPSIASSISKDLDATVFVQGSINQAGPTIRINAQLIYSKTEEVLKSFHIDGTSGQILDITDSLSVMISNFLIISELGKVSLPDYHEKYLKAVNSPEAYKYFIYGQNAFYRNDFPTAIDMYREALAIDSTLYGAMGKIALAYYNEGNFGQAREWGLKFYGKKDWLSLEQRIWADFINAIFFKTPNERNTYMTQLMEIDDQNPLTYFNKGDGYLEMTQYDKAIPEFEKALEIFHKRGTKPTWVAFYNELGLAYHGSGKYREEKNLYRKAQRDFPDDPQLLDQYAWLALTEGDTVAANAYIEKYTSIRKEQSWSDAQIAINIAYIYIMAKMPDKVEEYYRRALLLEPEEPVRLNALAYFLIDYERNIDEGIELAERVLETNPLNYSSLHIKGWGLFKQGKFPEARDMLLESWDLRLERSIYNHTAFIHLDEARKAAKGIN